ncbi:hypothetical protein GGI25_000865 [Coemansia spiralis]|uniref:Flavodoxin-like domain-containing protein n=2 Tax=Coemansia TaxID=4863 RepID=A0A9W8KZ15_9FUNG|nr:NAD(P)H:quinone oxidoreductase, type IV [Coemansia spiralis]KAJ1994098.1 hypothetical protein EDC05_001768 [Coemansia umbellata]KAJ2623602.1 hypothetical protein GGI26_002240 [Coemansia sp. RSA 1358]KAJ2680272.1 hypothetical protein GGI25_000865 [Coemansia spiralis]
MVAKIFVITYSTYGHINKVAESIVKGLEKTGAEAHRFQVAETLSDEVLAKMHAPPKADIPVITPDQLPEADGYLFGIPTRYGTAPAQFKAFLDSTGGLWSKQALAGKPAGFFFSTGSQHGGQESTVLTTLPFLAHHGMLYVPLGYPHPNLFTNEEVVGGSAWGSGTVANSDGTRMPSQKELELAEFHGEKFAAIATKLSQIVANDKV